MAHHNRYAHIARAILVPVALFCTVVLATAEVSGRPTRQTPQAPPAGMVEDAGYACASQGCRDPFQSWLAQEAPPPTPVCPHTRQHTPLEDFDLSVLTVTGLVWGGLGQHALISAPDTHQHVVRVGSALGQHCGEVAAITPDRLIIAEQYRQQDTVVRTTHTLRLPHAQPTAPGVR